jgi:hypothetical protein
VKLAYVLEDQSTFTDDAHGGPLTPAILAQLAEAAEYALVHCPTHAVCRAYGGTATVTVGTADPAKGEVAVIIRDKYPSQPGAGGWHTDDAGRPAVFISREYSTSLTKGPFNLGELLTHELDEASGDPGANLFADRGDGTEEAHELCDRVEGDVWTTPNGVDVSNWLLPSAFIPLAPGPFDFKGTLSSQYDKTPDGYALLRADGAELADQARRHPAQVARAAFGGSRLARRRRFL